MLINPDMLLTMDQQPPDILVPWLIHQDSLTKKLNDITQAAKLQVLKEEWHQANWWERHVIKDNDNPIFSREILITSNDRPCWYARSLIPENCYYMDQSFFRRLEKEPLAALIFNEPKVQRDQFFYYKINKESLEYHWLSPWLDKQSEQYWIRFAVFSFLQKTNFYLMEFLLPGLESQLS